MTLHDSADAYRKIFEHSPDAILIIEGNRFIDCNPAALRMMGFPDKMGVTGLSAVGVLILASVAGGAGLYGYFLRPLGAFDRCIHIAAALCGLGYVFNHGIITLLIFFALLAVGVLKPLLANYREREVSGAS